MNFAEILSKQLISLFVKKKGKLKVLAKLLKKCFFVEIVGIVERQRLLKILLFFAELKKFIFL